MTTPDSSIRELSESSERMLVTLRILFFPVAIVAVLLYMPAMLGAIMISDTGTETAINISLWSMIALTAYLGATLLVAVKWSSWPRGSAILLSILTFFHVVPLVLFPTVTVRIPLVFLGILGIRIEGMGAAIVGGLLYGVFFVIGPALSAWMLFRHASEMDAEVANQVNESWDLNSLHNKGSG